MIYFLQKKSTYFNCRNLKNANILCAIFRFRSTIPYPDKGILWKLVMLLFLMGSNLFVQAATSSKNIAPPVTIKGKITDGNNQPVPGVSIKLKGTSLGTVTNAQGEYSLSVSAADGILQISFIGYVTQEISINSRTEINVVLKESSKDLNEVVVVGYGTQKKVNLTGAVSSVSGSDISIKPVGQASAALEGEVAGVTVKQSSGRPGGDAGSINIRGIGTLSNSSPLILIDGIEGSIDDIDPNIIESVSVLKDAASASIYGSRAANGVMLITTKRAKGGRLSLTYNNYVGWQKPTNMPDVADALTHMNLLNEAYVNTGKTPLYSNALIQQYQAQNGVSSDQYPNTNWQKATLTGSGIEQSHFLTVNGGSEKVKMLASVGYFDQQGVIPNSGFKRLTLRNNADITISDKLSVKFDLQFTNEQAIEPAAGSGTIFNEIDGIPANQIGVNSNGSWGVGWNGLNPIAQSQDGGTNKTTTPIGSLNATINYKPLSWLNAEFTAGPKYAESDGYNFNKSVQTYLPNGQASFISPALSSLTESNSKSIYNTFRALVTLQKTYKGHEGKLLLGASDEDYHNDYFSAYRDTYILPDYPVINAGSAANQQTAGTSEAWALRSYFGRLNYDYKQKYLLELNGRYDGSSRFTAQHRWAFFPSASAGWRVSEENFMQPLKSVFDDLKIRASWGKLGNQNIGTYPSATSVVLGTSDLGKQIVNIAALNTLANSDITWETTEMSDVGVDMTLFKNFTVTADYYYRKTTGILLTLNIPLILGLYAPTQNAGVVTNQGWELAFGYKNHIDNFRFGINANLSDVNNRVVDIHGISETSLTVNREGYSIGSILGYQADGYFKDAADVASHAKQFGNVAPGDIKYVDQNGDGVINAKDLVILGGTIPRYTYGANLTGSYKGFDFNIFLQGVGKANGYLTGPGFTPFAVVNYGGTALNMYTNSWTPQNTNAPFPRLTFGETNNSQNSSFWVKNAAYMRVKNIQLGYTLPTAVSSKLGVKSLRVFANGSNLFTADSFWKGFDVESPAGQINSYPQVKVYSFGVNVNF
jgi:TonB-linked SusC/RagA family outer membrane protein